MSASQASSAVGKRPPSQQHEQRALTKPSSLSVSNPTE
jgi:hypothetical protein